MSPISPTYVKFKSWKLRLLCRIWARWLNRSGVHPKNKVCSRLRDTIACCMSCWTALFRICNLVVQRRYSRCGLARMRSAQCWRHSSELIENARRLVACTRPSYLTVISMRRMRWLGIVTARRSTMSSWMQSTYNSQSMGVKFGSMSCWPAGTRQGPLA